MSGDTSLATADPTSPLDLAVLEAVALAATRDAAVACQPFMGRGDKRSADGAATEAMRRALAEAPGLGTVVIGEGEKDGAPMLYNGERWPPSGSCSRESCSSRTCCYAESMERELVA